MDKWKERVRIQYVAIYLLIGMLVSSGIISILARQCDDWRWLALMFVIYTILWFPVGLIALIGLWLINRRA